MRRLTMVAVAAPVGLVAGFCVWLATGSGAGAAQRMEDAQARASSLRVSHGVVSMRVGMRASDLAATPIFALTTGKGAIQEPLVRLDGITRAPGRIAALLSIDGGAAEWMRVGDTLNGVTLRDVGSSRVTIETLVGVQDLELGEATRASPAGGDSGSTKVAVATDTDGIPPGFRSPPEPASAPTAPR